jgi:nicotinic acid mononucleotide adenylyltransferase
VEELARLVEAVDADGPVQVRWVVAPRPAAARGRIGLLPGSFNPPTEAHVALAAAGRAAGLAAVVYLLSKRTVDKERVTGLRLEERLAMLRELAAASGDAVAFVNRGLYVDLARAMREAQPGAAELVFLVGHDKIVQIFDRRYYADRDAALGELFGLSSFLVAPRAGAGQDELADLLAEPANRAFADRVRALPLAERYRDVSSTRARAGAEPALPPLVQAYLAEREPLQ